MLERSLSAFYSVQPDEVIICTNDPSPESVVETVRKIAKESRMEDKTKILPISRNPEYSYHQAWVRRSGFLAAKNDIILTSDVDLEINSNVLKTINPVGKNNVGMVSLSKLRYPYYKWSFLRTFGYMVLWILYFFVLQHLRAGGSGKGLRMTLFCGLYALYRPYCLDSEDDSVWKMVPTVWKQTNPTRIDIEAYNVGEDNYLRDCMEKNKE